jgi:hypothetical protein
MLDVQSSNKVAPTAAVANPVLSGPGLLTVNVMRYRNLPAGCQALRVTLSLLPWQSCTVSVNWAAVVLAAGALGDIGMTCVFTVQYTAVLTSPYVSALFRMQGRRQAQPW